MSEEIEKTPADRIAERALARKEKWTALEKLELELQDKYEEELGARGSDFQIVLPLNVAQVDDGIVVVKLPPRVQWQAFQEKLTATDPKKQAKTEDVHLMIRNCLLYPDPAAFGELAKKRDGYVSRILNAIAGLVGLELQSEGGK